MYVKIDATHVYATCTEYAENDYQNFFVTNTEISLLLFFTLEC